MTQPYLTLAWKIASAIQIKSWSAFTVISMVSSFIISMQLYRSNAWFILQQRRKLWLWKFSTVSDAACNYDFHLPKPIQSASNNRGQWCYWERWRILDLGNPSPEDVKRRMSRSSSIRLPPWASSHIDRGKLDLWDL